MNFDLSDEQKLLRDEARRFLSDAASFGRVRAHLDGGAPFDRALWERLAALGWLGVALPEAHGGLGLGPLECCVLHEELGRSLAPVPFFSTVGLAAPLLGASTAAEGHALLPAIAQGRCVVAVAGWEPRGDAASLRWDGRALSGRVTPVADLAGADRIVAIARDAANAPAILLLDPTHDRVSRRPLEGLCPLRPHGALELRDVPAVVLAQGDDVHRQLTALRDEAAVLVAFEQVGGAEAMLAMARDHALQRYAFGRPIGGNQAVKHRLADVLVAIELARSNAYYAAWAMEQQRSELPRAAAAARVSATQAFELAAEEGLHLHGGIGYTWECNAHLYVRRARLLAVSAGNPDFWSARLLAPAA
ncbi:MAG TPA: acyl-CoA dehydrogenase family protein [Nevskiaceae bacterium]|nr:acyl-CoA dehydrogenase family protein [Nevskiaceae bacterium]